MKKIYAATLLGVMLAGCQGSSSSSQLDILNDSKINSGAVLAKAGDLEVKEGLIETLASAIPNMKDKIDNPMAKKKLVEQILEQELLYQEGLKQGLLDNSEVKMKIILGQRAAVANALMQAELEKAMATEYEKRKDTDFTKVNISQIVIPFQNAEDKKAKKPVTDAQKASAKKLALEVSKKIQSGESFEELAKKHSDDKRTAERGGVAGAVAKVDKRYEKQGLKVVLDKAFALKVNEVSEPLETETGYYIIKTTSAPQVTPLEEAKRVLNFDLQNQVKTSILDKLKKDHPVEFVGLKDVPSAEAQPAPQTVTPTVQVTPTAPEKK